MTETDNGEGQMDNRITRIKEILEKNDVVIAISGPSGAGKDYLTDKALNHFQKHGIPSHGVQMTTERPHRGEVETKTCVSPEEYSRLQEQGKLIGDHTNNVRYGYNKDDVQKVVEDARSDGGLVVLELNPIVQTHFPSEMEEKLGVNITAWVGVETTLEQTRENMKERGETPEIIEKRLEIMQDFMDAMKNNPDITLVNNGPDNREGSSGDFTKVIEDAILAIPSK